MIIFYVLMQVESYNKWIQWKFEVDIKWAVEVKI